MLSRNDVIKVLMKCAGYDNQHTPDDSDMTIMAWQEHFEDFPGVTPEDAMLAVKEYHRVPRDRMVQPADISLIARKYSRERYERSDLDSAERRRLEEVCNTKAAPEAALEAADSPAGGELGTGAVGGGGGAEKNATEEMSRQRRQAIEAFAQRVGKPTPEIENRYLANLAQQRREGANPVKVPCPDCGLLDPCEHDEQEVAGVSGDTGSA
jgi:hypothetical protein